jgi:hypothetical protein
LKRTSHGIRLKPGMFDKVKKKAVSASGQVGVSVSAGRCIEALCEGWFNGDIPQHVAIDAIKKSLKLED